MEKKKRIIITDDDPGVQDAFRLILERAGYEVEIFPNGGPLLAGDFQKPDLIILDRQLSGVDGLDICRHLKGQEETRDIPVIMLSASPHIDGMAKAAGADDFIEKPFRMRHLLDAIQKQLTPGLAA